MLLKKLQCSVAVLYSQLPEILQWKRAINCSFTINKTKLLEREVISNWFIANRAGVVWYFNSFGEMSDFDFASDLIKIAIIILSVIKEMEYGGMRQRHRNKHF